jgi:hypothetical protein
LVDEIAVGAMNLDAVEAGGHGVLGRPGIIPYNSLNVLPGGRPGFHINLPPLISMAEVRGGGRGRGDRASAAKIRVYEAAHVP